MKLHPSSPSAGIPPLEVKLVRYMNVLIVEPGEDPFRCGEKELVFLSTETSLLGALFEVI